MDSSHINEWTRQLARVNYNAGRMVLQKDEVCLTALRQTADLMEAAADSYEALAMYSPPIGYFALPSASTPTSPKSVPMQREVKAPQGLGFTWAQNLTPRDEPDNPFSPRSRQR